MEYLKAKNTIYRFPLDGILFLSLLLEGKAINGTYHSQQHSRSQNGKPYPTYEVSNGISPQKYILLKDLLLSHER